MRAKREKIIERLVHACDGFVNAAEEVLRADAAIQDEAQRPNAQRTAANPPQDGEPAAEGGHQAGTT